ncbi:BrnA antitoxin family protein [Neorhizobium alkalisoli]|uniref:BrnA antitoxin family protein n=1 Tax=Neorhizobium alkalisoli TaxID=528178 RepID=UPI000CF8FCB4|nr:BrnA antitoxin family protein [Neorhizobium alkalisoli]
MKTPRRAANPRDAAEALFSPAKKPPPAPAERPILPNAKELVTLKLDSEVLAYFQSEGSRWQDRINAILRAAMNDKN